MKITNNIISLIHSENVNKNFVFSPYSFLAAVYILLLAVDGENKKEIESLLEGLDETKLKEILAKASKNISRADTFFNSTEYVPAIKSEFLNKLTENNISFDRFDTLRELCLKANDFADKNTHGLIKEIVKEEQLDELTEFALINAIHFKDKWMYEQDYTPRPMTFRGVNGDTDAIFLRGTRHSKYYEDADVQIVELPFKNGSSVCRIYVPRGSVFQLVNSLADTLNKGTLCKSDEYKIDFTCPEFEISTTINNLNVLMGYVGFKNIFEWNKDWNFLDFNLLRPETVVKIDKAIQKATFDFTKEGVEASAVTGMFGSMSGCCMLSEPPKIKVITANKPFLFSLHDSGVDLFVGVVNHI